VRGGRRLGDRFAGPAGELLTHVLSETALYQPRRSVTYPATSGSLQWVE
jgi:hypothetical protein